MFRTREIIVERCECHHHRSITTGEKSQVLRRGRCGSCVQEAHEWWNGGRYSFGAPPSSTQSCPFRCSVPRDWPVASPQMQPTPINSHEVTMDGQTVADGASFEKSAATKTRMNIDLHGRPDAAREMPIAIQSLIAASLLADQANGGYIL